MLQAATHFGSEDGPTPTIVVITVILIAKWEEK